MMTTPDQFTAPVVPAGPSGRERVRDALAATDRLDEILTTSGLPPQVTMDSETLKITLPSLTAEQALTMAEVMRQGMRGAFTTAEALNAAGRRHGIPFRAQVRRHHVEVAVLTIYHADYLATALGSPTPKDVDLDDLDNLAKAKAVVERLTGAAAAMGGARLSMDLLPACLCDDCGHGATVRFLPMTMETADCLLSALSRGEDR